MVDRLSDMPESLKLRILSSLDAKDAVRTSLFSKSWVSLWTCVPVLNFNSDNFRNVHVFVRFVVNVLSRRQSLKLDKLTFMHGGVCNERVFGKVFDYAFSHGVEELEATIFDVKNYPIWLHTSSDSLTSLKLESRSTNVDFWFLKPKVGSFKNLTNLHLKRVTIMDLDPFSGFPVLDKLRLVSCYLRTQGKALNIHALQLFSELRIIYNYPYVMFCEIMAPKLRYFEWCGIYFPHLKTHQGGLPVLDKVFIDYKGHCLRREEKAMFDDLLMLFDTLRSAKSLTIYSPILHLLTLFPYELANRHSPFQDLKCLKLDLTSFSHQSLFQGPCMPFVELLQLVPAVKAYLLNKSHDGKCTVISKAWSDVGKTIEYTF